MTRFAQLFHPSTYLPKSFVELREEFNYKILTLYAGLCHAQMMKDKTPFRSNWNKDFPIPDLGNYILQGYSTFRKLMSNEIDV